MSKHFTGLGPSAHCGLVSTSWGVKKMHILERTRKFITTGFEARRPAILLGMGVAVLALGGVCWLIKEAKHEA